MGTAVLSATPTDLSSSLQSGSREHDAVATALWRTASGILEERFSKPVYEMWLRPLRIVSFDQNAVVLEAQNQFARDWVESRFHRQVAEALGEVLGGAIELEVLVGSADVGRVSQPEAAVTNSEPVRSPGPPSAAFNARYGFSDFVVGSGNRFAHAAAMAVASAPARAYNPLFVYGSVGNGKTHLLHAIGSRIATDNPQAKIAYVSSEQFTNELLSAMRRNEIFAFRNRYRELDVLLLDDVQFLAGNETAQEEFFHTFNSLHEAGRQVVITSDRPAKEIETLERRLVSRFEWGLIADIQGADLETREAILRKKIGAQGADVPAEVVSFVARVISSNVRELEGALTRVLAYASMMKLPVTMDLAEKVLESAVAHHAIKRVTIAKIKETVASAHGITVKEMDNGRRDQRLALPRQIAMYVTTKLTNYSLPQIARDFGKKDHTTVMYARDKIKDQIERDEAFRSKIAQIVSMCQIG